MRYLIPIIMLATGFTGAAGLAPAPATAGLRGDYYNDFTRPNDVITFNPADLYLTQIDSQIDFWNPVDCYYSWQPSTWYGVRWTGYVRIDVAGDYAFGTVSDDGSQVWLDGDLIVDNGEEQWWDWEDSLSEGSYTGLYPEGYGRPDSLPGPLYLAMGYHAIEVRFYEARNYDGIQLWWLKPGSGPSDIPYYGISCASGGISVNSATNWEIVPPDVLIDSLTPVPEHAPPVPVKLHVPVPNPFNPRTVIRYDLPDPACVELGIFDLAGRLAQVLVAGEFLAAGRHEAVWNGRDASGRSLSAGVYVCRLEVAGHVATERLTLLK